MEKPAVTFIMAARNAAVTIRAALESIASQDYQGPVSTIVVDDASSDETGSIARGFPNTKVLRNEHQLGRSLSRNRAIDLVSTPLIAIHDADDISLPSRLSKCVPLVTLTDASVVGSQIAWIDPLSGPYLAGTWPESSDECIRIAEKGRMPIAHPTMIARTSIIRDVGGYDSRFPVGEDLDLVLRIRKEFPSALFRNIPEMGVQYRRTRMDPMKYAYSSAYWREQVMGEHGFGKDQIGNPWWIQASRSLAKQRIRLGVHAMRDSISRKNA